MLFWCLHSLTACDIVCQVSWKEGGELVAADWPTRGQLLPCHQACSLEAEGYNQATVYSARHTGQAGALAVLHV